jgi:hypothetical protein
MKIGADTWRGSCPKEEYRELFEGLLKYASENLMKYVSTDMRRQGLVSPENRKWFEKDMWPRGIAVGLCKVAAVTDANVFKRYYLNMLLSSSKKIGFSFKICITTEDAQKFLPAVEEEHEVN